MPLIDRRCALWQLGGGLGGIALAQLLGQEVLGDTEASTKLNGGLHHPAKVRRIVQLFMNGGVSQMDTFDYKPELQKRHGEKVDFGVTAAATSVPGTVMKSPFEFNQHGQSGRWVSSVFPQLAECVDDMAFLMAMASKTNVHGPASYMQNTGFVSPGFPSMGAWISYALGRMSDDLPAFVVLPDPRGLPYNNAGNFSTAFLPAAHQGVILKPNDRVPIANLHPPEFAKHITPASEADGLRLLEQLNRNHLTQHAGDSRLEARLASYELAARMQTSAPQVLDLSGESKSTLKAYGLEEEPTGGFGRNCLTARGCSSRACDLSKSGAERAALPRTGTTTATSKRNCRLSRAALIGPLPRC